MPLTRLGIDEYDLAIIGGGINGIGIAADAAGRGLKVILVEKDDFGSKTSSKSSKLIHGGLRYLEHYEFRLVKEALAERETLLKKAPHIIWPLRFQLPHAKHLRPAWVIRLGLFLYDHFSSRKTLAPCKKIKLKGNSPLQSSYHTAFEYSDAWVDDARLVILNALEAQRLGATLLPRTKCIYGTINQDNRWRLTVENLQQEQMHIHAKAVVNASGPWASTFFHQALNRKSPRNLRLVQGSHIIVPKLHDKNHAYILQNEDQRIVFVLPYENDYSLIGTTDLDYQGDPQQPAITEGEMDYLIDAVNQYFTQSISKTDVVSHFSGVRPLLEGEKESDASQCSRDYSFELDTEQGRPPILSIFGGKITTYRTLAEKAVDALQPFFPEMGPAWTATSVLPGGDFQDHQSLLSQLKANYPWLPELIIRRWVRSYGTLCYLILQNATCLEDLGTAFSPELYQSEVDYLCQHEWAMTSEDIIWRRTKTALKMTAQQISLLDQYIEQRFECEEQPMQNKRPA